uniref:Uncharacterized protein n=1 Tax=Anguilla anguilla TaxID=7936 RepID=A0A0E9SUQ4_ANGAN
MRLIGAEPWAGLLLPQCGTGSISSRELNCCRLQ